MRRELILYIMHKALSDYHYPKIDKLRIVKILYLLDRLSRQKDGSKLSDYNYILERLGPLSWEILEDLSKLKQDGIIKNASNFFDFSFVDEQQVSGMIQEVTIQVESKISKEDLDFIFSLAKNLSQLLDYVHGLEEVKNAKLKQEIW